MKSTNMSSSEKNSAFEHNGSVENEKEMSGRVMYIPTLPSTFNSLVGKIAKIETEETRYIIGLLGDLLGITDYETNKAAFWFLDTIGLQVLRYKDRLDDYYRSILISWLAGEMKLIRGIRENIFVDKKLFREDFFKEMRTLFFYVAEKLSAGDQLPHWELLIDECSEISKNSTIDKSAESGAKYLVTNGSSEKKLMIEDDERMSRENKFSFIRRNLKDYDNGKSVMNNLQEKPLEIFETPLSIENSHTDTDADVTTIESSNLMNPSTVLDIIIEATYNMYANELRYALVYAVFVTPIQIHHMPHTFRMSREIKLADSERESFNVQLRKRLEEIANELTISNDKKYKGKKMTDDKKKEQTIDDFTEVPPTPRSSLNEEGTLANTHRFIQTFIEAKETTQIYENTGNM